MERVGIILHGGLAPAWSNRTVPAIAGLVERLAESFEITVFTCVTADEMRASFAHGKARVIFLPVRFGSRSPRIIACAVRAFRDDHRRRPFSLVHGFWALPGGMAAIIASRFTGVPSVVSLLGGEAADLPEIAYGNMRKTSSRLATLWTLHQAQSLTVLTHYQQRELRKFGFTRTENVHTIPLGADAGVFSRPVTRPQSPPFHLLHIGHLNSVKDQSTLLRAFKSILQSHDCFLRIVGEGPKEPTLRRLAVDLGIAERVSFEGYVRHRDLPGHFAWAHLLLHTSLYEGQGVVIAEAAASGVPMCGTRVGLLDDLEQLVVTVPPGDDVRLAESVVALLEQPERRTAMETSALDWAAGHTLDWSAAKFAGLYRDLIAGEGTS